MNIEHLSDWTVLVLTWNHWGPVRSIIKENAVCPQWNCMFSLMTVAEAEAARLLKGRLRRQEHTSHGIYSHVIGIYQRGDHQESPRACWLAASHISHVFYAQVSVSFGRILLRNVILEDFLWVAHHTLFTGVLVTLRTNDWKQFWDDERRSAFVVACIVIMLQACNFIRSEP